MSSKPSIAVAVGALGLALLLTWPLALDPVHSLVGHPGNDGWNHAWGYWWVQGSVLAGEGVPSSTGLLAFPRGGALFFIDTAQALLTLPIGALAGPAAAYNAAVIFGLTLNGFATFLLARRVLRDDLAALVPAVAFEASAHVLGQAFNGISETVGAGGIPLALWATLELLDRPSWRSALALGAAAALCAVSNFYYGLFALLAAGLLVLQRAVGEGRRTSWIPALGAAVGAALVFGLGVAPVLARLSSTIEAGDALVTRDPDFVWRSLLNHNITDLVALFRPLDFRSPDLEALYGEQLLIVTYLGWVLLGLGSFAALGSRPRRELWPWGWIFFVFFLFALGPFLYVDGAYVEVQGRKVPLPFLLFFEAFPLFSRISHPFRFVVGATLGLGMLAGFGARELGRRWRAAPALAAAAVLVEVLALGPTPWPLPRSDARIPTVVAELRGGAVLDLPITVPNLERAVYAWQQSAHGQPIPYGLNDPLPDTLEGNPLTQVLLQLETTPSLTLPPRLPELELALGAMMLRDQGYRWVVLHERLVPAPRLRLLRAALVPLLGEPRREDGLAIWELR